MTTLNFHPSENSDLLDSLIACYQNVFSDEPWNEWLKCTSCQKIYGRKTGLKPGERCVCGQKLSFFWNNQVIKKEIFEEIDKTALCRVIVDNSRVIGFCWGYPIEKQELEKKLQLPGLARTITERFGSKPIGYIDELGVVTDLRLHGLGKNLWIELENFLIRNGCRVILARSRPDVKVFAWWLKNGYEIIQTYGGNDKRVIIARCID